MATKTKTQTGITVELSGYDGNACVIMGRVTRAMKREGVSQETIDEYLEKAKSGDYDNLLRVTMEYVEVE